MIAIAQRYPRPLWCLVRMWFGPDLVNHGTDAIPYEIFCSSVRDGCALAFLWFIWHFCGPLVYCSSKMKEKRNISFWWVLLDEGLYAGRYRLATKQVRIWSHMSNCSNRGAVISTTQILRNFDLGAKCIRHAFYVLRKIRLCNARPCQAAR